MAIIKEINIERFRAFKNILIPLGQKLTAIAGQNATGKSTVLGMLGQPFSFPDEETIFNKPFQTKFNQIFKLSPKHEPAGTHKYHIVFRNRSICEDLDILIRSRPRKDGGIRLVTRDEIRTPGKGNVKFPVIYLGLKRCIPIGEIKTIKTTKDNLDEEEIAYYEKHHNKILILNEKITPSYLSAAREKDTICGNTLTYSAISNSAGQDNVGQILGAMISFRRLKNKLGSNYKGGLLLIDEIDTAMYPGSQIRLMKFLIDSARELHIQIVFTTHSIEILEYLLKPEYQHDDAVNVLYLAKSKGKLKPIEDVTIQRIKSDLLMTINEPTTIAKINIYCEDAETVMIAKKLLPAKWQKRLNILCGKFSGNLLIELARSDLDEFKTSMFLLDGDQYNKLPKAFENVALLPGKQSPENMFLNYLESLPEEDEFWAESGMGYTKQHFYDNHPHSDDRVILKNWFKKERKHWGKRNMSDLYVRWGKDNKQVIADFLDSFQKSFNIIAKRKGIPYIEE
ncbi:MAG: AAA family ATPase [Syntrophomonas sp.]